MEAIPSDTRAGPHASARPCSVSRRQALYVRPLPPAPTFPQRNKVFTFLPTLV